MLEKEQENTSLNHRLQIAEGELDKREAQLKDAKNVGQEHETSKTTNEALSRKIQLLEEELDNAEKNLKETVERWVDAGGHKRYRSLTGLHMTSIRLRQMDLKAEHFERKVQSLEQERDTWENKYEVQQNNQRIFTILTFRLSAGGTPEVLRFQEGAR